MTAQLRKAFKFPADDHEDDPIEGVDEQGNYHSLHLAAYLAQ